MTDIVHFGEGSGVVKYRYIISSTRLTNPSITTSNSIEVTGKATGAGSFAISDLGSSRYIYVAAEDLVGNISEVQEITIPTYTVTYDYATNGGTSATKTSEELNYGNPVDLTVTATKTGYTFVGWNPNKAATTKLDTLTMSNSNITVYAIFRANTYTVKYNANGATAGSTAKSTHTYDLSKNLT